MSYQNPRVAKTAELLKQRLEKDGAAVLRATELRALFDELKTLPPEERGAFGKEVNALRAELQELVDKGRDEEQALPPIDVTAPFDANLAPGDKPRLLSSEQGSRHPLMTELDTILDIF
jgi:hypothetical protein